jgi:RNA polymerase sigma-70 factor (ECF subfamily)
MTDAGDDLDLMRRLKAADPSALRLLMARHHVRIFRFVARIVRNDAVAEEVANEVFLEAWRNARTFEGRANVATWLYAIAHNRALSSKRRRREEAWDEERAAEIADEGDDPEVTLQKQDTGAVLRRALLELSEEHRVVIDLAYYHELSIAEIAGVTNVPEATVKTRMFYARKRLAEILKAHGIERGWP